MTETQGWWIVAELAIVALCYLISLFRGLRP